MSGDARGASLAEVLVALFLIALGILAVAPMFVSSMYGNAAGADLGSVGALAVARMERLRGTDYDSLVVGGGLDSDVSGYSDTSDSDFTVRWEVASGSPAPVRIIRVRALAHRQVAGQPKSVDLVTIRGR